MRRMGFKGLFGWHGLPFPAVRQHGKPHHGRKRQLVASFRRGRFGFQRVLCQRLRPCQQLFGREWLDSPAPVLPHRLTSRCMTLCPRPPCAGALERQANEYRTGTLPRFKQLRVFHHRNEGAQGDNGACDFGGNAEVIPLRSGRADGRDGKKPCKQPCDGKRVLSQHRTQRDAAAALHDACRCQLRTAVARPAMPD